MLTLRCALLALPLMFLLSHQCDAAKPALSYVASGELRGLSRDGSTVFGIRRNTGFMWSQSTGLVDLPIQPQASSFDGSVLVESDFVSSLWHRDTGIVEKLPAGFRASGLSGDASTVIGHVRGQAADEFIGYRWTRTSGLHPLGFNPLAVSHDGSVIYGTNVSVLTGTDLFKWTDSAGAGKIAETPGGHTALHTSRDGSVVAGNAACDVGCSWYWTQETGFKVPSERTTLVRGVSADGSTLYGRDLRTALRWKLDDDVEAEPISPDGDAYWSAFNSSADGAFITITGPVAGPSGVPRLVWIEGRGFIELRDYLAERFALDPVLDDFVGLMNPLFVSDDGTTLAGMGNRGTWITVVPEPQLLVWLLLALPCLGVMNARHRFARASND